MKVKKIKEKTINEQIQFCDITTATGNFMLAHNGCVIHNSHISSLLMVLFLRITPKLLENSFIYRAIMPLYGSKYKGKFYPLYTEEELTKFKEENPNAKIQRYKGLGEMNPDELKICLLDKETRRLDLIQYPENPDDIFKLMSNAELKRNLLNSSE